MKSLGDAFILRNHALAMLEMASVTDDAFAKRAMLTFVVAGAGFAGVETVGGLNDFVREAISYYPALAEAELRVVLVHPNSVILPELSETLGRYAQGKLASRNVEIRTDTSVIAFSERGLELSNGETLPTQTLVWTAGVTPPAVLQCLPAKKEKDASLSTRCWKCPVSRRLGSWRLRMDSKCGSGKAHPPTGTARLARSGALRKNVVAAIRGSQSTLPLWDRGAARNDWASRRSGGYFWAAPLWFPAWCLWRTIYLAKLPTFEKKLRVALRWTLDFAFPRDLTQHVTLHGIDRVSRLLAYVRQHPVIPPAVASDSPSAQRSSPHAKRTAILEL
jgi:NADH dehydrogenase